MTDEPYNPLHKRNLGKSVAQTLLERAPVKLGSIPRFEGAGIYALYYVGVFDVYKPIADLNRDNKFERPIYVGKAIPAGARRGNVGLSEAPGTVMWSRLKEHADSIRASTKTLNIEEFWCRYLIVDDIWIPLGESLLIGMFTPLWNQVIDGFGNHDPGGGRYQQVRSRWDVLHPGRAWAEKCQARPETLDSIHGVVTTALSKP